ncbi:hypothetical protein ACHAWC_007313 [Mediolabrus comicus]
MADRQPPQHQPLLPMHEEEKLPRKHKCCFCCCHLRGTVIWIQVFFGIMWAIAWLISYRLGYYKTSWTSDPQILQDLSTAYWRVSVIQGVGIGVAFLVILGAIRYNAALVSLGAIYIVIENILTPIYLYPVLKELYANSWLYIAWPIIYGLLILYPHVVFVYEIKTGVWETPNYSD